MVHVGINAHLLAGSAGYRQAGIHHYIYHLINHLPQQAGLHYTVFTGKGVGRQLAPQLHPRETPFATENPLLRIAWEQTGWPWALSQEKITLSHSMAFVTPWLSRVPQLVTIYDLSFVHHPERFTRLKRVYLQSQTARAVRSAEVVIAIAEDGRQAIHRHFGLPLEKIAVIYPGVSEQFRPLSAEQVAAFRREKQLNTPFLLHVGTLQPRKNITTLLEAFARLPSRNLELVLVGGKGWLYEEIFAKISALGLTERVRLPGYVDDEELVLWFNAANCFVFPSVYEGFGLPVAQAMACGTPVIASQLSSLPEVVGDAGLLFDPQNVGQLAEQIGRLLEDPHLSAELSAMGKKQAEKFRWTRSALQLAELYLRVSRTTNR